MLPCWGYSYRDFEHCAGGPGVDSHFLSSLSNLRFGGAGPIAGGVSGILHGGIGGPAPYVFSISLGQGDDDFADRCSHTFTALILLILTLLISCRQYIGKPISCWVPTEFTRAQEEYAENVCWVTSTYFLPSQVQQVPISPLDRQRFSLGYYQWVPFLLMTQALLCNVPYFIWKLFNWQSGVQLSNIMQVALGASLSRDPSEKQANMAYLVRHMQENLHRPHTTNNRDMNNASSSPHFYRSHLLSASITTATSPSSSLCRRMCISGSNFLTRMYHRLCHCCSERVCCLLVSHHRFGNYVSSLYLVVKFLYLSNILGQVAILHTFVQTNYTAYGLHLLLDLVQGRTWHESGNFPRVTLCDFEIRKLANTHRYTVQCVLPINMFNEKIFIFLWFWFLLVSLIMLYNCSKWCYRLACGGAPRHKFVRHFLTLKCLLSAQDRGSVRLFVNKFLRPDGVFLLYLMHENVGELFTADVVERLWLAFKHTSSSSFSIGAPLTTTVTGNCEPLGRGGKVSSSSSSKERDRQTIPKGTSRVRLGVSTGGESWEASASLIPHQGATVVANSLLVDTPSAPRGEQLPMYSIPSRTLTHEDTLPAPPPLRMRHVRTSHQQTSGRKFPSMPESSSTVRPVTVELGMIHCAGGELLTEEEHGEVV